MLHNDINREMYKAFTKGPLRGMLKTYTLSREDSGGVFNPITGTTTGGSGGFSVDVTGILRDVSRKIVDGVNITNDMSTLTLLQESAPKVPEINDSVDDGGDVPYRVVDIKKDPADVFYNLILRRAA